MGVAKDVTASTAMMFALKQIKFLAAMFEGARMRALIGLPLLAVE